MGNLGQAMQDPNPQPAKESFLNIPLKTWASVAISLIAVCAALAHYSIGVYRDLQDQKGKVTQAKDQIAKAAQEKDEIYVVNKVTSANTDLITKEMEKHKKDHSGHQFQLHTDDGDVTVATYFESDGCIAIKRPGPKLPYLDHARDNVEWSLGPSIKSQAAGSLPLPASRNSGRNHKSVSPSIQYVHLSAPRQDLTAPPRSDGDDAAPLTQVQTGCLNPHPYPFQSWWGPANGCFAPLYRKWNDGCTHYQIYNSCNGQWDPRIFWTYCNPNHHP